MSNYYDLASFDEAVEKYPEIKNGIVVDSCLLYGASFRDDQHYRVADEFFDKLHEYEIPVYSNVVTRAEFLDLVARKTLTRGAVKYFEEVNQQLLPQKFFNFLKNIRDKNKNDRLNKKDEELSFVESKSYKLNEEQLKKLRRFLTLDGQHPVFSLRARFFLLQRVFSLPGNELRKTKVRLN